MNDLLLSSSVFFKGVLWNQNGLSNISNGLTKYASAIDIDNTK